MPSHASIECPSCERVSPQENWKDAAVKEIQIKTKDGKIQSFRAPTPFPNKTEAEKAFRAIHKKSIESHGWEIL